ncbi:MAG: type IV toxin-antitoxin system AbiEi family antitoxin domain-containing protein [Limisphaerales bacterium]
MNQTRFQIARPDIIRFYDELPIRIHRQSDIAEHLKQQREFWRLTQNTTARKFIRLLIENGRLRETKFPFPSPYKPEVRYPWGNVSLYEVMQTIKPESYFSHYTAMKFHGLSEQLPKTTYLTVEQVHSSISVGQMTQAAIDRAFQNKPRVSGNIAETKEFRVCIVAGRNTGKFGVVEQAVLPDAGPLRLTNLERTLIDITVRPIYAGGVYEVAKAFELAKEKVSVNALAAMLKKLKYTYPYHQTVGFYLERAGYKSNLIDLLRKMPMEFDFYLTHKMGATDYVQPWRLHVPKGF